LCTAWQRTTIPSPENGYLVARRTEEVEGSLGDPRVLVLGVNMVYSSASHGRDDVKKRKV